MIETSAKKNTFFGFDYDSKKNDKLGKLK